MRVEYKLNSASLFLSTLVAALSVILFFLYFKSHSSLGGIAESISSYKTYKVDEDASLPTYLNLLVKATNVIAHLSLFVIINNSICGFKSNQNIVLLLNILLYCTLCILNANRGDILQFIMAGVCAWYILYHRNKGWKQKENIKFLKKGIWILAISLFVFWGLLFFTRSKSELKYSTDFLTYVCSYVSGSLASFDVYIKQGGSPPRWFGEETFVALNNNLSSIIGFDRRSKRFLEFRSGNGYSVVNIYSSFRRFYHDFGTIGVVILSFIQGFITSFIYKKVKASKKTEPIDFVMCVYCIFFYTIPYTIIDELFYSSNISISGLLKLITILFVYIVFFYGAKKTSYETTP